jgi:hypothetical protein
MATSEFGLQEVTDEDRSYKGSTFKQVVDAVFANPYQRVWGAEGEPPLPVGEMTLTSLLRGGFANASARTLDSGADLRWGPEGKGFRRLVHPNGVCLVGKWRITEASSFSGYFERGREALVIGRYSTCCTETHRGKLRSLALVGKLFPTTDPAHQAPLRTANFITQEDLGGSYTDFINDVELRNAPDTTISRRGACAAALVAIGLIFGRVDSHPSIRQLYPIAELGKPADQPTRAPEFMRLLVAGDQPRIPGEALDFRDEVMAQIFDRGDPTPKRSLSFTVEVTDEGVTTGSAVRERRTFQNWKPIGSLTFTNAVVSYNGDSVIHFSHPTWRADKNDPSTATRIDGKRVR